LPTKTRQPPSGEAWLHEIKHDGFRLMVRRDSIGIRLLNAQRVRLVAALSGDCGGSERAQGALLPRRRRGGRL
jgi:hypothetical protein